jgi:hypothetical protein
MAIPDGSNYEHHFIPSTLLQILSLKFLVLFCSVQETKQLAAVLAHPQFKSNPFAAIQQHLSNTLPSPPPPPQPNTKQMSNQKPGAKNKTRKKNAQSMDVA